VVHPQAGDLLEQVEAQLPLAEAVGHAGQRTELHAAGGQPDQVGGDPVDLHDEHPDGPRALRHLDAEQLLHGHAVAGLVEQRGQVVHPRDERRPLRPVAVLDVLLDAGVQVADDHPRLGHRLALEVEHQPQDAVRGRVLRPHVDDEALLAAEVAAEGLVPVAAGDGVDAALGGLPRPGVRVVRGAHRRPLTGSCAGCRAAGWSRRGTRPGRRRAGSPCAAGARPSRRA
jgi:hypothetical protein